MIFFDRFIQLPHAPKGPEPLPPADPESVTLEEIISRTDARRMAWKDVQTFIGFLAKRLKELEDETQCQSPQDAQRQPDPEC